jgi:hypothetical protein
LCVFEIQLWNINSLWQKHFHKLARNGILEEFLSILLSKFYSIFHKPKTIFARLGIRANGFWHRLHQSGSKNTRYIVLSINVNMRSFGQRLRSFKTNWLCCLPYLVELLIALKYFISASLELLDMFLSYTLKKWLIQHFTILRFRS